MSSTMVKGTGWGIMMRALREFGTFDYMTDGEMIRWSRSNTNRRLKDMRKTEDRTLRVEIEAILNGATLDELTQEEK